MVASSRVTTPLRGAVRTMVTTLPTERFSSEAGVSRSWRKSASANGRPAPLMTADRGSNESTTPWNTSVTGSAGISTWRVSVTKAMPSR